jgi:GAF domain-containing protein
MSIESVRCPRRLQALHRLRVLDTPRDPAFDGIARTPMSVISLLDHDRQWFKAKVGVDIDETPIEEALCVYALSSGALFVVPDAAADARFRDNRFVVGRPHIRF